MMNPMPRLTTNLKRKKWRNKLKKNLALSLKHRMTKTTRFSVTPTKRRMAVCLQ